ncbi:exported hypothetical protein [Candidatus Sulfobium mesophilum]|uniref:DUF4382 domain-containing protein n=1 Tax=Candidatus Sulfobium mesophilum TaxID=2016548 RepID=A0A2U3QL73_9BACT|nr:exported hypothetical protein [Candidatus Sulfobium mesophilum]
MKKCFIFVALICGIFLSACGGGGGTATFSSGTLSVEITDAKPVLPTGVAQVFVTIDEVSVHSSGGQWVSLSMAQTPFTMDLLQLTSGRTTQLVPPATLAPGKYTQLRLGVQSAMIVTDMGQQLPVTIASGDLKTDKNFNFDVTGGGAVTLTVDFDLSQSLVVTGSGSYKLKPVLHLVNTAEAATITGSINVAAYGFDQAVVIVTQDSDNSGNLTPGDEEYTRLVVAKAQSDPTPFSIYWLVPGQSYIVEVQIGGITVYSQAVAKTALPAGAVYPLKNGNPI